MNSSDNLRHFVVFVRNQRPYSSENHQPKLISAIDLDHLWESLKAGALLEDALKYINADSLSDYSVDVYELAHPDPIPFDHLKRYTEMRQQQDQEAAAEKQKQLELKQLKELAEKHGFQLATKALTSWRGS